MHKFNRRLWAAISLMAALVVAGVLPACGGLPGAGAAVAEARSDAARDTSPDVGDAELGELASGNTTFAFDLYQALRAGDGNIVYSPYSISAALAMTYAGARGETEQQMADTLHFTLPQDTLHPAFNAVDLALAGRSQAAGGEGDDLQGFQLNVANALWGQESYPFAADFLDLLALNYGAGMSLMDFQTAPDDSRQVINNWVAEQTEDRIQDLLPEGSIDSSTRLVLTNAIYFYSDWLYPFPAEGTADAPFTLLDGSEVTVPMMNQGEPEPLRYGAGEDYQAVEIPYEGNEIAMLILLPNEGQFETFEASLDAARLEAIQSDLSAGDMIILSMPRFEFATPSISLKDVFIGLGMTIPFSGDADFSGMVEGGQNPGLAISDIFHKAFIRVDEEGTEAAAATAVVMFETAIVADEPVVVRADRPFIFMIYDRPTGTILFMGRVLDPR